MHKDQQQWLKFEVGVTPPAKGVRYGSMYERIEKLVIDQRENDEWCVLTFGTIKEVQGVRNHLSRMNSHFKELFERGVRQRVEPELCQLFFKWENIDPETRNLLGKSAYERIFETDRDRVRQAVAKQILDAPEVVHVTEIPVPQTVEADSETG